MHNKWNLTLEQKKITASMKGMTKNMHHAQQVNFWHQPKTKELHKVADAMHFLLCVWGGGGGHYALKFWYKTFHINQQHTFWS